MVGSLVARRYLANNQLTGAIPSLTKLKVLNTMWIEGNSFDGGEGAVCSDPASSNTVELKGAAVQTSKMGVYTEVVITADNDYPERGGRPAFYGLGYYLYYLNSFNDWNVGPSLGGTTVAMYADSSAAHPTAINAGTWAEVDGSGGWVDAPDVTATCVRQCAPVTASLCSRAPCLHRHYYLA